MRERLEFGFSEHPVGQDGYMPVRLDIPSGIVRGMQAQTGPCTNFNRLKEIHNLGGIDIEDVAGDLMLLIRADEIGRMDFYESSDTLEALSSFMLSLKYVAESMRLEDEDLEVTMGGEIPNPLWMEAELRLAKVDEGCLQEVATRHMCQTAQALRYPTVPCALINLVHAERDRRVLSLQIDTHCGVGVLAGDLEDDTVPERLSLSSNNMEIYQQQVIALAGVVALAKPPSVA